MPQLSAPASYLNARRPPLQEALELEGGTLTESMESLERKGCFTPLPTPWELGSHDQGMGRSSFAVLDCFGDVVVEVKDKPTAELIIAAVNAHRK